MSTSLKYLFDLSGRTALVTGGSRGLGLQISEALGEYGARIVITARKLNELDEAIAYLKALGTKPTTRRPVPSYLQSPLAETMFPKREK